MTKIEVSLKRVDLAINGLELALHLTNKHEIAYYRWLCESQRSPQIDIDHLVFQKFIAPGSSFLDLGANIGFTSLLAHACGANDILAIEALPSIYERLRKIDGKIIKTLNVAVSEKNGSGEMFVSKTHNQGSTLSSDIVARFRHIFGEEVDKETVETRTLDDLIKQRFDFWKLDIEGAEFAALRSGTQILKKLPPKHIYAEIYDERELDGIVELLAPTHPYVYRAFITQENYALSLVPIGSVSSGDQQRLFHHHSPTYIFSSVD